MQSKIRYNEYTSETALHDVANWLNRCGQDDGAEKLANGDYVICRKTKQFGCT